MNAAHATLRLIVAWIALSSPVLAGTSDSPRDWLDRMSAAMSQMSYQGTFVYVRGDDVVTMRITHVVDENGARERLVSLSGAPREVLRDSSGVRWVLGDDQSVLEDSAEKKGESLLASTPVVVLSAILGRTPTTEDYKAAVEGIDLTKFAPPQEIPGTTRSVHF